MSDSNTEQFKKDWITTLTSTSGIMLTVCLMILTILYTASSIFIHEWQRLSIAALIVLASIFLMFCAIQSLEALGTLIIASTHREKGEAQKAKEAEDKTAERAREAQQWFKRGLWFLIIAVVFSFFFLNWSIFICK